MQALEIVLGTVAASVFFVLGVPILLCIGVWVVFASLATGFTLANIGTTCFTGISKYALLAMPLFILTGDFIRAAGIARRLAEFAQACLGWLRGALGMATLAACGMFAAISGSNSATTAAIGSIMIPEMEKEGYNKEFAAATSAAGGTVGIIIPPSIIFIVYGFLLNLSIGDLFIGGIIPGVMMVVFMMIACHLISRKNKWGTIRSLNIKEAVVSGWRARLGFIAMFVVLYGIYSGKFSPTEASGVTAGYCFLAGLFLTRGFRLKDVPKIMLRSSQINGLLAPVIAISVVMQQILTIMGAHEVITNFVKGLGGYYTMLFGMMFIILIAGTILESLPDTIILAPILAPIAHSIGVDPIHFGVIFLVGDAIGFITPPYGLNLYVASGITGIPYFRLLKYSIPYFFAILAAWILTAIFPWTALWLLSFTRG